MTWKSHPGIWFTIYAFELWFFLSLVLTMYKVEHISAIMFGVTSMLFYFIVYYHAKWLDGLTNG